MGGPASNRPWPIRRRRPGAGQSGDGCARSAALTRFAVEEGIGSYKSGRESKQDACSGES